MISLKVLSTAAAMTLVLPIATSTASFADPPHRAGPRPAGSFHPSGNFHPGGHVHFSGGGNYHHGGGFGPGIAAGIAGAAIGGAIASQTYYGGPGYYYDTGPAYVAGAAYYDDQYDDDSGVTVAEVPATGGGDVAYCMQTYRSYDPQSGTYLGFDGYRHPCP